MPVLTALDSFIYRWSLEQVWLYLLYDDIGDNDPYWSNTTETAGQQVVHEERILARKLQLV